MFVHFLNTAKAYIISLRIITNNLLFPIFFFIFFIFIFSTLLCFI